MKKFTLGCFTTLLAGVLLAGLALSGQSGTGSLRRDLYVPGVFKILFGSPGAANAPFALGALTGTDTVDIGSAAADACATEETFTITGAALGDVTIVSAAIDLEAGAFLVSNVSAANTVAYTLCHTTGSAIDHDSDTFTVLVFRSQ